MIELHQTDTGIFYICNYCPKWKFKYASDKEIEITKSLWDFKNGEDESVAYYEYELLCAIEKIVNQSNFSQFALASIPSSKMSKTSIIEYCIEDICLWYDLALFREGEELHELFMPDLSIEEDVIELVRKLWRNGKHLHNMSGLLRRSKDIPASHLHRKRPNYQEQYNTIECTDSNLDRCAMKLFLIDDITTTGTSMDVCQNILIEHGLAKHNIIKLAIARTI